MIDWHERIKSEMRMIYKAFNINFYKKAGRWYMSFYMHHEYCKPSHPFFVKEMTVSNYLKGVKP